MTVKELLEVTDASIYVEVRQWEEGGRYSVLDEDYCDLILKSIHRGATPIGIYEVDMITLHASENGYYNDLIIYTKW